MSTEDPTLCFGPRTADYERARPGYPAALVPWLMQRCGLGPGDAVADIGSGTGLFARELLQAGLAVHAVEPNAPMRRAAERGLAAHPGFFSHDGRAEASGLLPRSVALVTAAQSFHWFEADAARAEFARILAPRGRIALVWNVRRVDTPFLRDYEDMLLRLSPAYRRRGGPQHASLAGIAAFFAPHDFEQAHFGQVQRFDRAGLHQRLFSSSYAPPPGRPGHAQLAAACDAVFAAHARQGQVEFPYDTQLYLGPLD
jgi:SAM-dependent methyltransferase